MIDMHLRFSSNPRENTLFRALLFMTIIAALASMMASVVHWHQARHGPFDLIVPPICGLGFLMVAYYLYRFPQRYSQAAWMNYFLGLFALTVPAWYFPDLAFVSGEQLIAILPPISSALFPLLLTLAVFVRPKRALIISAASWLLIAAPILAYLSFHPAELLSPRGHDLAMTLGPVMVIVVAYLAVHKQLEAMALKLHQQHQDLQIIAKRDVLTRLYNRRTGEQIFAERVENAAISPFGIVMLDVDHFKRINDQFGHPVGDDVLRAIATAASAVIRESDVLVRWGGEEFLLFSLANSEIQLCDVAERIRSVIAALVIPHVGQVTVSLGATLHRIDQSAEQSLQRADKALYSAKNNGRNQLVLV